MPDSQRRRWTVGQYLTNRSNPELGIGRVSALDGRIIIVEFPKINSTLRYARDTDALVPVDLAPGRPVRVQATLERTTIAEVLPDGQIQLATDRVVAAHELWPLELEGNLIERLALGDVDDLEDFVTRLGVLALLELREATGLASFLGGRIRLFPHQLYVAERAVAREPVRWLLADEVGLGKTIEAALILNRLVHGGRVTRCLVIAPESLTVQWLGELWRKYHQVFTLLDEARLADVARDFGDGFNPFDVHPRAVIALETLVARPELTGKAVAAGIDLLVVDEAQRLRRPPGHPGEPGWRAVAPIAALGRHVLLLTATPLEGDAHGLFRLLQMLRPEEFPDDLTIEQRMAAGIPLPPCVSSTRRTDIGGLPPRVAAPVWLDDATEWRTQRAVEAALRSVPVRDAVARRLTLDRIRRSLASGAALAAVLGPEERTLKTHAAAMDAEDPRLRWLVAHAPRWRAAGEKSLVFVAHRETLERLRTLIGERANLPTGVFHEALPTARRDTEVARFREPDGPSVLISTECGGEGRNFEFCHRIVLFDMPWNPAVVEQRIGRLDRIGRRGPVEVVYFRPPAGLAADVVRVYETLGIFRAPLAGLEPELAAIERAIESAALDPAAELDDERLARLVSAADAARPALRAAAARELHRDPYRAELAAPIIARVPMDLDARMEEVVVNASTRLGFSVEQPRGRRTYAIEIGSNSLVDGLPGVPGGASFVGTFDREEAVTRETIDFFASGHALVEGLFAFYDETALGRVARFALTIGRERGDALVAVYKDGPQTEFMVLDATGATRPDWAAALRRRPLHARRLELHGPGSAVDGTALVRRLAPRLDASRRPVAVALMAVRPVS